MTGKKLQCQTNNKKGKNNMSKIETMINTILIAATAVYFLTMYSSNEELKERVSNLENMVRENESDGIIYGRHLVHGQAQTQGMTTNAISCWRY